MDLEIKIINPMDFKTSSWSGGTTTELCIFPPSSNYKAFNFNWRLSSATVDLEHSTFTKLPNIFRYICTLEGDLLIKHNDGDLIKLSPFQIHKFQGDWSTESFGKVKDFNLMLGNGCDGFLQSLIVNNSITLDSIHDNTAFSNVTEAFFSPSEDFILKINTNKELVIKNQTLVLITTPCPFKNQITLSSKSETTILRATMML